MNFFDSEVVRAEMTEIQELQEDVYQNVFAFPNMTMDEKKEHILLLQRLLEKQRVLYTRLSLSDDPEAVQMKENILKSAVMMGMPPNIDMSVIFSNMDKMISNLKVQLDMVDTD
tara:strand:- start:124 stop:465 length:342 start_codon:yes stop_codon:yes gene_type:complete